MHMHQGFFSILRFTPTIRLTAIVLLKYCWDWPPLYYWNSVETDRHCITEILLRVALNTHNPNTIRIGLVRNYVNTLSSYLCPLGTFKSIDFIKFFMKYRNNHNACRIVVAYLLDMVLKNVQSEFLVTYESSIMIKQCNK